MTTPTPKPHQRPPLALQAANREQRRIAADFAENVRLIEAAVAPAPDVLERIEALERLAADQARMLEAQAARIAVLEARPADDEDGTPRCGIWCTAKEAAYRLGYSPSGLRLLAKKRRIVFDTEGNGRRLYNIASISAASAASAS
jgi:hypothetical protein